jgi:hypothetical protein
VDHTRAVRMTAYSIGEEDIQIVRTALAANGIYAANVVDIDAMGIPDPEGHSRHVDDRGSDDGRTQSMPQSGFMRTKPL